jgi:hypothetical protein
LYPNWCADFTHGVAHQLFGGADWLLASACLLEAHGRV